MGFFPTEGCSISAAKFTDQQKDLVQTVIDNNAFINPINPSINKTNTAISNVRGALSNVQFSDLPEWAGLSSGLASLSTNTSTYKTHSNRLSGKNLNAIGPDYEPGFSGLYGIASSFNSVKETMEEKNEDNFSQIFHSILGPSESALNSVSDVMNNKIVDFIALNVGVTSSNYPEGFTSEAAALNAHVSSTASQLTSFITQDNNYYSTAINYLDKFSLGNMLMSGKQDPCFGGKMIDIVVTDLVRGKLDAIDLI